MNKFTYIWSFTLATLMLSSCYDSMDNSIVIESEPDTPILISTAITGSVVDANGNEITNYQLATGDLLENIESKRFLLQLENINKKGQAIYVKNGYQINSILHTPLVENDINLVNLQIFDPMNSSLISSSDPDLIDINPSISLQISTDNVKDLQGNIPTQDVFLDYRDLSTLNNISQLGASAYTDRDQLRSTRHINAFHIELRGADGTTYNIANPIKINLSLDNNNEVSLFRLDTQDEQWKEIANLEKGNNTIEITKTGMYTISQHIKAVYAEGDVNKEGTKVAYQLMSVDEQNIHSSADGRWISIVAAEKEIDITTLTPCQNEISSFSIPATSIDVSDVDLEVTTGKYYKLQTEVYDCNGALEETTGIYLRDEIGVGNIYTFSEKNLDAWVSVCNSEFDISTYDIDTDLKGSAIPWSLDIQDDQSFLVSCQEYTDGYSYIKIQDDRRVFPPFKTMKQDEGTTLQSSDENIRFKFKGQMADNYAMEDVNVLMDFPTFGNNKYFISCENSDLGCGFTTWNVTHYEAGSEKWVRVSFSGRVWMQIMDPPQAGYFPVEGVILTQAE